MKIKLFKIISPIAIVLLSYYSYAQDQSLTSLKVAFDPIQNLPEGVVLGVNGQVYIQDSNDISTRLVNPTYIDEFLLIVEKGVVAEDLAIGNSSIWLADYVFEPDYKLISLEEIKKYTEEHKHLPGVIGQKELEKQGYYGINEMLIGQLKNIEELLLHTIAQEKEIKDLQKQNETLKALADKLERGLKALQKQTD